ncbi:MAG: helix-turn-helix domain-containing protein [Leptolyngbyaceae cyanobacterium]
MTYPDVSLMQKAAAELGYPAMTPFFPEPIIADPAIVGQFRRLHQCLEQNAPPLERESRLLWFLSQLIHRHGELRSPVLPIQPPSLVIEQAQAYLQRHHQDAIRLADLASAVDVSPLQLLRLCRKAWGLPPHRYLIQIRVRQAKQLISEGLALSEVAAATGFADQSHLNRHFKRMVGVTPGQYQQGC